MRDVRALKRVIEHTREEEVDVVRLFPNRWNFNEQTQQVFKAVVASIRRYGNRLYPVVVRDIGRRRLEIIDGEHRWRACREAGLTTVWVKNLGVVDDSLAEELMLLLNEDRGESDTLKLAKLVEELKDEFGEEDVKERYPFTEAELRDMELFSKVNWESFPEDWQAARRPRTRTAVEGCQHVFVEVEMEVCDGCGLIRATEESGKVKSDDREIDNERSES